MTSTTGKWERICFGEVAEFRNGLNFTKDSFGKGVKVIGVGDFQDYTVPRYNEIPEINPEGVVKEGDLLQEGDILFVRSNGNRELIGRSLFIQGITEEVSHSGFTIRARINSQKAYPRFFAYLFRTQLIRQTLSAYGGGTNINNLNQKILQSLEVPLPPLPVQRKIAAILSAYDDLIENNLRRIKILEAIAQNLYREWFVKFRFPGHQNTRFVDSPLGRIPEGWEVVSLGGHLIALESGKRPKGGAKDEQFGVPSVGAENVLGIGRHNFQNEKYVSREFFESMRKGVVKDGDVALYKDGAYIGKSSYFRNGFPHTEFCVNEHVFLLRTNGKRITQNSLYLYLQETDTISAIRATNANAAQPGINQSGVSGLSIILPAEKIVQDFDQLVDSNLAMIVSLAKTNQVLRHTRDLLLPKLISGEVDVSDLSVTFDETSS